MLRTTLLLCAACSLLACDRDIREAPAAAWDETKQVANQVKQAVNAPVAPNNSGANQRDQSGVTKTPLDQGNGHDDLRVTQQIRQALVSHEGLSFEAKNIKVMTEAGRVTLRGPVESASERSVIEDIAIDAAGTGRVDNQLEVKTNNQGAE